MSGHEHHLADEEAAVRFELRSWEQRLSGQEQMWSGKLNRSWSPRSPGLTPGTALDAGSGDGGDVIWLARRGWSVTGADFSAAVSTS